MKKLSIIPIFTIVAMNLLVGCGNEEKQTSINEKESNMSATSELQGLYPDLSAYISEITKEFDNIPEDRKASLDALSAYIQEKLNKPDMAYLTFICTHNSRRSHISQIWAQTAAKYYHLVGVSCFSGGTEITAFNQRSVEAMKRTGFRIDKFSEGDNPVYEVKFANDALPIMAFSKVYQDNANPKEDFCAIMTCSQADANCPLVRGAEERISIPYEDPKEADNTEDETKVYDERVRQIATEMFYVFSKVKI